MGDVAIRPIEPGEEARAVSVQVMAFAADPCMRWIYPDPHAYLEHFPAFVSGFGGLAFESKTAYVADDFSGVAMWLPVGAQIDGGPLGAHLNATVDDVRKGDLFSVLEKMGDYHPEEPHWYLAIIGVDPACQGSGIGSALLQHSLGPCDDEGLPAYLESSNPANVPLYERHGFEVMGEIQVGDSAPVFPMYRRPR